MLRRLGGTAFSPLLNFHFFRRWNQDDPRRLLRRVRKLPDIIIDFIPKSFRCSPFRTYTMLKSGNLLFIYVSVSGQVICVAICAAR
jgi:hypothetical protein